MQLCIRRRDRAATVAHCRRLEGTLGRELEFLPNPEICLLYEMAMRGGQDFLEEGNMKD
jgi:hypothetical protein